jgi:hypothetical protein
MKPPVCTSYRDDVWVRARLNTHPEDPAPRVERTIAYRVATLLDRLADLRDGRRR